MVKSVMTQEGSADDQANKRVLRALQDLSDKVDEGLSRLIDGHVTLLEELHEVKHRLECITAANRQLDTNMNRLVDFDEMRNRSC